jgi:hypothetical protein
MAFSEAIMKLLTISYVIVTPFTDSAGVINLLILAITYNKIQLC